MDTFFNIALLTCKNSWFPWFLLQSLPVFRCVPCFSFSAFRAVILKAEFFSFLMLQHHPTSSGAVAAGEKGEVSVQEPPTTWSPVFFTGMTLQSLAAWQQRANRRTEGSFVTVWTGVEKVSNDFWRNLYFPLQWTFKAPFLESGTIAMFVFWCFVCFLFCFVFWFIVACLAQHTLCCVVVVTGEFPHSAKQKVLPFFTTIGENK